MIYLETFQTFLLIWLLFSLGRVGQLIQACFSGHKENKVLKTENQKLRTLLKKERGRV